MLPRLVWLVILLYTLCAAAQSNGLTCTPGNICEKCPEDELHQPYCQPFGNRRLMYCRDSTSPDSPPTANTTTATLDESNSEARPHYAQHPPSEPPDPLAPPSDNEGATLAWESCGRIVAVERADFFEFATVNFLFACMGIGVVVWRSRRMRVLQARHLAARIDMAGRRR